MQADETIFEFKQILAVPDAESIDAWRDMAQAIDISDDKTLAIYAVEALHRLDLAVSQDTEAPNPVANLEQLVNKDALKDLENRKYEFEMRCLRSASEDNTCGTCLANVAVAYLEGLGIIRDYRQAMKWYLKAADRGSDIAMYAIGFMYHYGRGVKTDDAQALVWFRKSADGGNGLAMTVIGQAYQAGNGVDRDFAKAMIWYCKAANANDGLGMNDLGSLYELGLGVKQDYAAAMIWYRKGSEAGCRKSCGNVARLYEEGLGVEKNAAEAAKWRAREMQSAGN